MPDSFAPPDQSPAVVGRRAVWGWACFDFANSPFTTLIVTFVYSTFFASVIAPENGGVLWANQTEVDAMWRRRNNCTFLQTAFPTVTYLSATTICRRWECSGAPVETCTVSGLDHCWVGGRSGGFPTCVPRRGDVDATKHMMDLWDELAGVVDDDDGLAPAASSALLL